VRSRLHQPRGPRPAEAGQPVLHTDALPLPHDDLAERRLIGGLLREPEAVVEVVLWHGITGADLYQSWHQVVWVHLWELIGAGVAVGPAELYLSLCESGAAVLEFGGARPVAVWIADVWNADPTGAWSDLSCESIREMARRRAVIHQCRQLISEATSGVAPENPVQLSLTHKRNHAIS